MSISSKIILTGFLFLLIIITGLLLTRSGKPYHPALFNIHKLISLGTVVYTGILVYTLVKTIEIPPLLMGLIIAAGILFLILIISGGLLNLEKSFYSLLRTLHRIMPAIAIIMTSVVFYWILKK